MIETSELQRRTLEDHSEPVPIQQPDYGAPRISSANHTPGQVLRFIAVGGANTMIDLLVMNAVLWLLPTTSAIMLLAYNVLAYSAGAINSFLLNKYWTFGQMRGTTRRELARFTLTTLCGIAWNTAILWLASSVLHPLLVNPMLWANASKVLAISGTALISYLGMRLWVFVNSAQKEKQR